MDKRIDITALGEALIDFTECGRSDSGARLFEQNPGGAPANVLCAAARLGARTAFIGKVGDDMHGEFLRETLAGEGVDVSGMVFDSSVFTTLAFVALKDGERSFSFARKPGADTRLCPREVSETVLEESRVLHVCSLSLTDEPVRSATLHAVHTARKGGAVVSYDPNYRATLWPGEEAAREQMRALIPLCDVMKLSLEEAELLTGEKDPEKAAEQLLRSGPACVAVTLGGGGALAATRQGARMAPAFPVEAVDTTGAGDAYWGAFLYCLTQSGARPEALSLDAAERFTRFANAAAALCVGRRGAIPAMPTLEEVRAFLG